MNKKDYATLIKEAERVAQYMGSPTRQGNSKDSAPYIIDEIIPLSSDVACVKYRQHTNRLSIAIFFLIRYKTRDNEWLNFFPSDAHILGMTRIPAIKQDVEIQNGVKMRFDYNATDSEGDNVRC